MCHNLRLGDRKKKKNKRDKRLCEARARSLSPCSPVLWDSSSMRLHFMDSEALRGPRVVPQLSEERTPVRSRALLTAHTPRRRWTSPSGAFFLFSFWSVNARHVHRESCFLECAGNARFQPCQSSALPHVSSRLSVPIAQFDRCRTRTDASGDAREIKQAVHNALTCAQRGAIVVYTDGESFCGYMPCSRGSLIRSFI
ncbi:hypothetical protein MRX96_030824 [Rhipicephalus microplus]